MRILPYQEADAEEWNAFIRKAKNGHFFFHRDFLAYHKDRFEDASYLIRSPKDELIAVLVANRDGHTLHAHQGLSFGGMVWQQGLHLKHFFAIWDKLLDTLWAAGVRQCVYRMSPAYQTAASCDELTLAFSFLGARKLKTELSSVCRLPAKTSNFSARKRRSLRRSAHRRLVLKKLPDWKAFAPLLIACLGERHGVSPVHTEAEMHELMRAFPEEIEVYGALQAEELLAGATLFHNQNTRTTHVQYLASSAKGRKLAATDFLIAQLLERADHEGRKYFSFGVSSESDGAEVNAGLLHWKEKWGAELFAHETYLIDLSRRGRPLSERLVGHY